MIKSIPVCQTVGGAKAESRFSRPSKGGKASAAKIKHGWSVLG